jgi:hypothetical protein
MMDVKVIGAAGLGMVFSLMLGFFLIPIDLTIERAILVEADPEDVYPLIVDLQRWDSWDPWDTAVLGEPTRGAGAQREWPAGGVLKIDDAEQDIRVHYTVSPAPMPTNGSLELLHDEKGTAVVWTHYTQTGYLPSDRLAGWVARAELALELDKALELLKAEVEGDH